MNNKRLKLYKINMKYMRNLGNVDKRVMSVSPQTQKHERVFLGIVVMVEGQKYCIPLSSNKQKFEKIGESITLRKIKDKDGNVIAVLNLNNMVPVRDEYLDLYDLKIYNTDSQDVVKRKKFCEKELAWCQKNQSEIERLAKELHRKYVTGEQFAKRKICLDFPALERECNKAKKFD